MMEAAKKYRAPNNRTITLSAQEEALYSRNLLRLSGSASVEDIENRIICQDLFDVPDWLPTGFVDLLFLDPPYNLDKAFNTTSFSARSISEYADWLDSWLPHLVRTLKSTASVYICGDWRSSTAIHLVAEKYLKVRNRITWEREKGRGAKSNWKNCSEDLWFCTVSDDFHFDPDAVKVKRRVIAPYTDAYGRPKDWDRTESGNHRLTYPSNLWTDLTVPFWSMPENTDHPTQKPEKLLAKIILASTATGGLVFDPFCGSGTSLVAAKKLGRRYIGIEIDHEYCCLAEKRLALAGSDRTIQGYADGVFWERNSLPARANARASRKEPDLMLLGSSQEMD